MSDKDLQFMLGKITAQLDEIVRRLDEADKNRSTLQTKVEEIEGKMNKVAGVIAVFSLFFSLAATYVWNKVTGKSA